MNSTTTENGDKIRPYLDLLELKQNDVGFKNFENNKILPNRFKHPY
jgi:hypothetical protein